MRSNTLLTAILACAASILAAPAAAETSTAIFAGGCFWCVESDFDHVQGVTGTTSGYLGGTSDDPTYHDYVAGGHREAVKIDYDPAKVSYALLLGVFWHSVDPTDADGQFCDRGRAYSTAIYAIGSDDLAAAEKSKLDVHNVLGTEIATEILPAPRFWPAEDYHQDYYLKNPVRYRYYRYSCGRDDTVARIWGEAAHQGIEGY
jgi:peptide-methionine (S)-S-oxide reductase